MKKIFIFALMVLVGISLLFHNVRADEARTISRKTYSADAGNTVVSTQGAVVYRITGYASSSNARYAILNASAVPSTVISSTVKVEGGQATQYNSLTTIDFGDDGLVFNTGIVVLANGCSVVIEYI